jgi:hypothetical protein
MKLKPIAALAAGAALIATAGMAQSENPVINAIVADLEASGYTYIEVDASPTRIEVEARGAMGQTERHYTADGVLLREETDENGVEIERVFDADGNVTSETIDDNSSDDDGDDDGHDDDDGDDDDDDEEEEDDDDDDDEDDDDEEDDDDDDDEDDSDDD